DTSVLVVPWERASANFSAEGAGQLLGCGLLGGLLYTFTFYTVSQLGTYIFVGIALMILLCYLFSITWLDLIEGIQSITSVVFNWLSEFWDTTKQQFSSYREDREKYKADQSKQKASRSKATKKSKQSGERSEEHTS